MTAPSAPAAVAPHLAKTEAVVHAAMRSERPAADAIVAVCRYQDAFVPGLQAFWRRRGFDPNRAGWLPHDIPAVPTDTFRSARLVSREAPARTVFRTSGTTGPTRGEHWHISTSAYEEGAWMHATRMLPLAEERPLLLPLALPHKDSSLAHMIRLFQDRLPAPQPAFALGEEGRLAGDVVQQAVEQARALERPILLFGTAFALAHAVENDGLPVLPPGSRTITTGGFKGRETRLSPSTLLEALVRATGLPEDRHHTEYGMTEWSSQLYSAEAVDGASCAHARRLVAPPWCVLGVVDPETLEPVSEGEPGLVRLVDPANVDSVIAVQTSDRGRMVDGRLELLGRSPGATPRGCSLAVEELHRLLHRAPAP